MLPKMNLMVDRQPQSLKPAGGEPSAVAARRILVVDDNCDSATSLAALLKLTGYDTRVACDGLEGVETAAMFRPDAVVLDICLPKLNGYEACRRIRKLPGGDRIVLIALTGCGLDDDVRQSKEAGFDGHLVKPAHVAALLKLLAQAWMTAS